MARLTLTGDNDVLKRARIRAQAHTTRALILLSAEHTKTRGGARGARPGGDLHER